MKHVPDYKTVNSIYKRVCSHLEYAEENLDSWTDIENEEGIGGTNWLTYHECRLQAEGERRALMSLANELCDLLDSIEIIERF